MLDTKEDLQKSLRPVFVLAIITIALLTPFISKAFHIDDPLFVWTGKHILTNPIDFYGFEANWYGLNEPIAEITKNPPAACYYLALIGRLFGFSEIALHTGFMLWAVMAVIGTYYLAKNFCDNPIISALAMLATPVFLLSSTTVMCDVMMLALWIWAIVFWKCGIDKNKFSFLLLSGITIAACALTKYYGMSLIPLLFVYALHKKRRFGSWILFLVLPMVLLAGYQWATYTLYGRGLLLDAASYAMKEQYKTGIEVFSKGLIGLGFTGGCLIIVAFYFPLLWSRKLWAAGATIAAAAIIILLFMGKIGEITIKTSETIRWNFVIHLALFVVAGTGIIWLTITNFWARRNADATLLFLWVTGTFIFASLINWDVNGRSILPMAPAVAILLTQQIESRRKKISITSWHIILPLIASAIVALSVTWADFKLAGTAKTAAFELHNKFDKKNRTLWFQGHWGFQYYIEAMGGKAFTVEHTQLKREDLMIIPGTNTNVFPLESKVARLSKIVEFKSCSWLATMNTDLKAGFYAGGPLPFAIGSVPKERYLIMSFTGK